MPTEHIFATGAEAASDIAARIATAPSASTAQASIPPSVGAASMGSSRPA